jgi:hypothetical protein
MTKLPRGPLKIITIDVLAAASNRQRALAGSTRFKPVWRIFVLNEDGESFTPHTALQFRASSLTPRNNPRGIRAQYPQSNSAMRRALDNGIWFETRSEVTLDADAEVPAAAAEQATTEEKPANGEV